MASPPPNGTETVLETATVTKIVRDDGVKMINTFEVVKKLGKGSFGKVKLCRNTHDGELYAIKVMDKNILRRKRQGMTNMLENVKKEIAIMKKLNHPHCVRMYEVIDDPDSNKLYLRLEYVSGGQCMPSENGTTPLPLEKAQSYFADLIIGLEYLHHNHVLHRDIKPENLLVTAEGRLKLADFGVSQHLGDDGDDLISKSAGTPAFMAPECCVPGSFHGKLADIWAAGVSLYFFVHGSCPFVNSNVMRLYEMIQEDPVTFKEGLPPPLLDLLKQILNKNPSERLKIAAIKEHEWFKPISESPNLGTPVAVSEAEIANAFSMSERVVLLVKIRERMLGRLRNVRNTIAERKGNGVDGKVEAEAPPVSIKEGEQQAVEIPEGMVEQVDSDDEGSKGEPTTSSRSESRCRIM